MNSIEVTRSAKELDQLVKDFEKDRARKDLPALSEALMHNKLDVAQALVDSKADVNEYAKKPAPERGMAPIHFAKSAEAVQLLANAGAKIDAPYKELDRPWGMRGETKLQTLALTGKAPDMPVIEALLKAGADGNRRFSMEFDFPERIGRDEMAMSTRLNLIRESAKPQDELQLSIKGRQDKGYTLIAVATDFQQIMKEADRQREQGLDVLVNERANPNIVHAKSNVDQNVDVGRVIQPAKAADGTYVKGTGEVVLASFFTKLPIETNTYYSSKAAEGQETVREPAKTAAVPEVGQGMPKDAAGVANDEAAKPAGQAKGTPSLLDPDRKIVLTKTDYALPEGMVGAYNVKDGKFKDRSTDTVRFEDHGKKLSTKAEDRAVVADMIAVAEAKNWGTLELKGTENFRQLAWLEASARGMEVRGYKPNERDLEQLEQLKRERGVTNVIQAITSRELESPEAGRKQAERQAESAPSKEPTVQGGKAPQHAQESDGSDSSARSGQAGGKPVPGREAAQTSAVTGALVEHGKAKYNFDPEESQNYYARLSTPEGEKVIWGKDLERAIEDAKVKPGQVVTLERKGAEDVIVTANKRDEKGAVVGKEVIDAQRNKWEVTPVELKVTRPLSEDEKLRVDAAAKVLGKEMAKYPAEQRESVLAKLTEGLNNGTIKLPSPKVAARSLEKPTPDQSRAKEQEQARSR